jgi:hypothetical protein
MSGTAYGKWTVHVGTLRRAAIVAHGGGVLERFLVFGTRPGYDGRPVWCWDVVLSRTTGIISLVADEDLAWFGTGWHTHSIGDTHWPVICVEYANWGAAAHPRDFTEEERIELTIAAMSNGLTLEFPCP